MRYLLIGSILFLVPLFAELSIKRIDHMVEQIQSKRSSKVNVEFSKVASPFVVMVRKDENSTPVMKMVEQQIAFRLDAIINEQAMINGRWLKVGEQIEGYTVDLVEESRVVLKKSDRTVELFLPKPGKSNLLQISEGAKR